MYSISPLDACDVCDPFESIGNIMFRFAPLWLFQSARIATHYRLSCCVNSPAIKPQEAAMQSPLEISMEQRRQEHVTCELGQVVPKVLVTRSFPDDYKVLQ